MLQQHVGGHGVFRAAAFTAGLIAAGFAAWIVAGIGGDRGIQSFDDLTLLALALAAAAACAHRARRESGRARRAWWLLAAATTSWAIGEIVWAIYELPLHREVPFPGFADIGYLAAPPLAAAAMLWFPTSPRPASIRIRTALDGLIISGSVLFVSWATVLGPLYRASSGSLLEQAIGLAYPLSDVAIAAIVIFVIARAERGQRAPLALIGAGLLAMAVADSGFAYFTLENTYASGNLIDLGWVAAYLLIALGALRNSLPAQDAGAERPSWRTVAVPYFPVSIAVVAGSVKAHNGGLDGVLTWTAIAVVGSVLIRQIVTLRENLSLTKDLEGRVADRTAEVRAREEHFRSLVQNSSDVITLIDADGAIRYQSQSARRVLGHDPAAQLGANVFDLLHPDDAAAARVIVDRIAEVPGDSGSIEVRALRADGSWRWTETRLTNLLDDPNVGGIVVNQRDVAERRRAEDALRQTTALVRLLQVVAIASNEASTIEVAMERAVREVCALTGWPVGHALVSRGSSNGSRGVLSSSGIWHLADPVRFAPFVRTTAGTRFPPGTGLPGRVARSGKPVWVVDIGQDPSCPRAWAASGTGLRAGIAFPVLAGEEVAAVLEFFAAEAAEPDPSLLEVMAHIGTQLGRVIERTRAAETLCSRAEETRSILETANDAFVAVDAAGIIIDWNRQAERTFGWNAEEVVGLMKADSIISPRDSKGGTWMELFAAESAGSEKRAEILARRRDGRDFLAEIAVWALRVGQEYRFNAFVRDISERKRFEEQLEHQALHDPLTDLANRTLFEDRVAHALARAARAESSTALLFVDLDDFKNVNDSLGHAAGDRLLVAASERITACLRPGDTIARLGGDEFGVLVEDVAGSEEAAEVAGRILDALRPPLDLGGKQVFVRASIGIAAGARGTAAEELLRNADLAMYMAKARGKGRHEVYEPSMHAAALERLETEADLRWAVDRDELRLDYQPIVDLRSGETVGVEALVRWRHPDRGIVSPLSFIPIAEDAGLIVPIGRWVLREACRQGHIWADRLERPFTVCVNLSARQLQDAGLVRDVTRALEDSGMDPRCLVLEITESVMMQDTDATVGKLNELKALGARLAIDDFGTGYSSLAYLRRFPLDILKIDKSFIDGVTLGTEESALARAIIKLARTLGLRVVAEGIEEAEQVVQLQALRCDLGQGFHLGRPAAPEALDEMLGAREALATAGG